MSMITPDQRRAAKEHLLADLQQGCSVSEAHQRTTIPLHRTTIYRFRQRVQADPIAALVDGRHGHPIKLRGEVRDWLVAFCQETPHAPSHVVQMVLQERFSLIVSISQLNRFRAAHHISSRRWGEKSRPQPQPRCLRLNLCGKKVPGVCCCWQPPTRPG